MVAHAQTPSSHEIGGLKFQHSLGYTDTASKKPNKQQNRKIKETSRGWGRSNIVCVTCLNSDLNKFTINFPHQSVVGTLIGYVGTGVSLLSMTMAVRMFRLEDQSPALKGTHVHACPGRQQSGCCGEGGTLQ